MKEKICGWAHWKKDKHQLLECKRSQNGQRKRKDQRINYWRGWGRRKRVICYKTWVTHGHESVNHPVVAYKGWRRSLGRYMVLPSRSNSPLMTVFDNHCSFVLSNFGLQPAILGGWKCGIPAGYLLRGIRGYMGSFRDLGVQVQYAYFSIVLHGVMHSRVQRFFRCKVLHDVTF